MQERAHRRDPRARGDEEQRPAQERGAVEAAAREPHDQARARAQRGEVATADALADLAQHGAVLDERDGDVDVRLLLLLCVRVRERAAAGDAELAAAQPRKERQGVGPGDADGGEVVQDLEDRAARARGVVEELVGVGGVGELEEALAVRGGVAEVRREGEEVSARDGGDVEAVEEEAAEGRGGGGGEREVEERGEEGGGGGVGVCGIVDDC